LHTVAFFDRDVSDDKMNVYASELSQRVKKRSFTKETTSPGGSSETTLNGYVPHLSPTSPESLLNHEGFGLPAEVAEAALVEAMQTKLPSCGSLGHPEACRRPCIYFLQGNCENGDACVYCHLPHPEKTPKLDKRQRTIVQGLERPELLALIFTFCKAKAEDVGFSHEAGEILQLLEEESKGAKPLSDFISERDIRNLQKNPGTNELLQFDLLGDAPESQPCRSVSRERRTPIKCFGETPASLGVGICREKNRWQVPGTEVLRDGGNPREMVIFPDFSSFPMNHLISPMIFSQVGSDQGAFMTQQVAVALLFLNAGPMGPMGPVHLRNGILVSDPGMLVS